VLSAGRVCASHLTKTARPRKFTSTPLHNPRTLATTTGTSTSLSRLPSVSILATAERVPASLRRPLIEPKLHPPFPQPLPAARASTSQHSRWQTYLHARFSCIGSSSPQPASRLANTVSMPREDLLRFLSKPSKFVSPVPPPPADVFAGRRTLLGHALTAT
jgi:hypothetical protein